MTYNAQNQRGGVTNAPPIDSFLALRQTREEPKAAEAWG
jgi:hypothetical protein